MTKTPPDDDREIRNIIARWEAAWNASDSLAFANLMSEDADFISVLGDRYHGREIVERGHRHIFDTIYKDSRVSYTIEEMRKLRPDVVLVFLHQRMISRLAPEVVASTARQRKMSDEMHESQMRATVTLAKDQGQWHIVAVHNTSVPKITTAFA